MQALAQKLDVADFAAGLGGDRIDLSAVLRSISGYQGGNPFAAGYVQLRQQGSDTLLVGMPYADEANAATLMILRGVDAADLLSPATEAALTEKLKTLEATSAGMESSVARLSRSKKSLESEMQALRSENESKLQACRQEPIPLITHKLPVVPTMPALPMLLLH